MQIFYGDMLCTLLHILYGVLLPKCICDYVNMCAKDDKFIFDISCSNVIDFLKIIIQLYCQYQYTAVLPVPIYCCTVSTNILLCCQYQ